MKKSTFWDVVCGLFCFIIGPCIDWPTVIERLLNAL